jgi:hypothetical protein
MIFKIRTDILRAIQLVDATFRIDESHDAVHVGRKVHLPRDRIVEIALARRLIEIAIFLKCTTEKRNLKATSHSAGRRRYSLENNRIVKVFVGRHDLLEKFTDEGIVQLVFAQIEITHQLR